LALGGAMRKRFLTNMSVQNHLLIAAFAKLITWRQNECGPMQNTCPSGKQPTVVMKVRHGLACFPNARR